MDPGYAPENRQQIERNAELLQIPLQIFDAPIFDVVDHIEQSPCYLCARMRRGYLYKFAKSLGCNKIALGHHFDDVVETILMSTLYAGEYKTMMPKLHSTNSVSYTHLDVYKRQIISRPLFIMVAESMVIFFPMLQFG